MVSFSEVELLIIFIIGAIVFFIGHKKTNGKIKAIGGIIAIVSLILIAVSVFLGGVVV